MMKRSRVIVALVTLSLVLAAGGTLVAQSMPGADAAALWKYITTDNPYEGYQLWPGTQGFYKGTEPHGVILRTFVNSKAYLAITKKKGVYPEGSIIVKENYSPKMDLAAVTVMYKIKGYDPEHNDWYWAKYDPKGMAQKSGKPKGCIDCHGVKKDNDYAYTGSLK
jgi:hypothetical protein